MTPILQTKLHSKEVRGNCLQASLASFFDLNLIDVPSFELMERERWKINLIDWLENKGVLLNESNTQPENREHYILIGLSERGILHCVIGKEGMIVHDPHPSKAGLLDCRNFWQFKSIK